MNKFLNVRQKSVLIKSFWWIMLGFDLILTLLVVYVGHVWPLLVLKYLVLGLVLVIAHRWLLSPSREQKLSDRQLVYRDFLERINHIIVTNLNLRESFPALVQELSRQVALDCCLIYRVNELQNQYCLHEAFDGTSCLNEVESIRNLENSWVERTVKTRKSNILDSIPTEVTEELGSGIHFQSVLQIPMVYQNQVIGVFVLGSGTPGRYQSADALLLEPLVERVTSALQNSILYEEMRELSLTDYLTGLANRRALDLRLKYEYHRAKRYQEPFSVLVVDVDFFKPFNDKYGHLAGDEALREIAQIMKNEVREVDLVSRFGGEEFVILLTGTTREEAGAVAERIRGLIEAHVFLPDKIEARITVCIGVGTYTEDIDGIESLLHGADLKLYSAKSCGRNRVVYID